MIKEIFETGKSVDAAIESACEKLGCSRDDCVWEIIDLPKKGFLGLKNTPAKVRVSIETPDEKPVAPAKPVERPRPQVEPRPPVEQRPLERKPPQPPTPQERPQPPVHVERPRFERPQQERIVPMKKATPLSEAEVSDKEKLARDYLAEVLGAAGLKADYVISHDHGGTCINIVGDGLGMIIGRRGETLDAIQYLTGLVANRGDGEYLRLTVDCGDYRIKRQDTLESLAKKLASQVIKTNISKTLEPMNPFERRIIHATVSEIEGVSSASIGEEPNRRVVITSPTAKPALRTGPRPPEHRDSRSDNRGNFNRNREPRRESRPPVDDGIRTLPQTDRPAHAPRTENTGARPPRPQGERTFNNNRDNRERRDDRRPPRAPQPVPSGPPKQTPESQVTTGVSFGKIELD